MRLNTKYKTDRRIEAPVSDLFKGRIPKIKFKEGFKNSDICREGRYELTYNKVFFTMLELMALDVIEGHKVIFNESSRGDAFFYVDYRDASPEIIRGKGEKGRRIRKIDFKKTRYRVPMIVFDVGLASMPPARVKIPRYLYSMLIDKANQGKAYFKGTKVLWFNDPNIDEHANKKSNELYKRARRNLPSDSRRGDI